MTYRIQLPDGSTLADASGRDQQFQTRPAAERALSRVPKGTVVASVTTREMTEVERLEHLEDLEAIRKFEESDEPTFSLEEVLREHGRVPRRRA